MNDWLAPVVHLLGQTSAHWSKPSGFDLQQGPPSAQRRSECSDLQTFKGQPEAAEEGALPRHVDVDSAYR